MDTIKQKLKNRRLFLKRDAKLDKRLREDYIDNGIATLPCKVSGMDEIISHFSVPGYEHFHRNSPTTLKRQRHLFRQNTQLYLKYPVAAFQKKKRR